ncbi:MAG TPA: ribosome-associated translation inhibitor RaiA [Candidatus Synoicihabitans sp.]|nr:ribosome-associated translation inhibitor RaiA [Candidatus Synoicihabitans sp.]
MTQITTPERVGDKLIVSGIHLELTAALKRMIAEKTAKLLRHEPRIVRLRVDLEFDRSRAREAQFVAKGRIEIGGPDILAAVATDDAYRSIDELVAVLDRALRKRHDTRKDKRNHPHAVEIGAALPKAV